MAQYFPVLDLGAAREKITTSLSQNFTTVNLSDLSNNQIPERFFQGESAVWPLVSTKPVSIILNDSNSSPEEAFALQIKGVNLNH